MKIHWYVAAVAASVIASTAVAAPALATTPTVDTLQVSRATIYPVSDGYQDTVSVTGTATGATVVHIELSTSDTDAAGTQVFQADAQLAAGDFQLTLDSNLLGTVPSGSYFVWARPDDVVDTSAWKSAPLSVSLKHLVTKTWKKTVTAAGSKLDKFVGGCSTLRKPSLRGWAGSLGYYSNTRCKKTAVKSVVATVHGLVLPAVSAPGSYGSVRIAAYGGAAKAKPRSHAYLAYLTPDGSDVVAFPALGSKVRTHAGPAVAASQMRHGRTILWGATVAAGNRYDIKNFTVTLTYTTLQ